MIMSGGSLVVVLKGLVIYSLRLSLTKYELKLYDSEGRNRSFMIARNLEIFRFTG